MNEPELCHWLLLDQAGNCRSVFAPIGDRFENYRRIGPIAVSTQFVFPMAYAVVNGAEESPHGVRVRFCLHRDDAEHRGPAFSMMDPLKIATLTSELASAIAEWVGAVGNHFHAIRLLENVIELEMRLQGGDEPLNLERALTLTRAGIEMMAFARGLKCEGWQVQ